jgi:hypothetical protein
VHAGQIVRRILSARDGGWCAYIGDGSGDVCGCLQLRDGDVVLARDGYSLLRELTTIGTPARVVPWADGATVRATLLALLPAP